MSLTHRPFLNVLNLTGLLNAQGETVGAIRRSELEVFSSRWSHLKSRTEVFPGDPGVKTSPSNAGGAGSIPGQGVKIPHASGPKNQNIKQKLYHSKFNEDF